MTVSPAFRKFRQRRTAPNSHQHPALRSGLDPNPLSPHERSNDQGGDRGCAHPSFEIVTPGSRYYSPAGAEAAFLCSTKACA